MLKFMYVGHSYCILVDYCRTYDVVYCYLMEVL
jgi:hypothetical protein